MAGNYRVLYTYNATGDIPKNAMSNTLYYQWSGSGTPDADERLALLGAVEAAYLSSFTHLDYRAWATDIRMYDMSDVEPRPLLSQLTNAATAGAPNGDREAALCLSYYSGRNLPSTRGRVYLGPFTSTELTKFPAAAVLDQVISIGTHLHDVRTNWEWMIHSVKHNTYLPIDHWWCDNSWDHISSRGVAATARVVST
jgi:hypothetical protein